MFLGLYIVEDYWKCRGLAGFQVYKFLMKRIDDQPPAPWTKEFEQYRTRVETMKTRRMTDWKSNGTNGNTIENCQEIVNLPNNANSLFQTDVNFISETSPVKHSPNGKTKPSEEATSSKTKGDDNKENNTVNFTENLLNGENFTDSANNVSVSTNATLSNLPNDPYRRSTNRRRRSLPERCSCDKIVQANENNVRLWVKQAFTKLCETPNKKNEDDASDVFKGFDVVYYPTKLVLLGFLVHEMENKLFGK